MLLLGELECGCSWSALFAGWRFQRGAHQNPLLGKRDFGWGSGLTLRRLGLLAAGLQPAPTCKRDWTAAGGHRRDFMVGCPLAAAAAVLSCRVQPDRWIAPHLAIRTLFDSCRWECLGLRSLFSALPFGLLLGCLLLIRVGVPSRLMFRGFGRGL